MIKFRKLTCYVIAVALSVTPAFAEGLNLTVDGVRNAQGSVIVLVFDNQRAYDHLDWRKAVEYADIPAHTGRVSHSFPNLNAGPYAIFLFHDENGDQDLNYTNERFLEGVGASGATTATSEPNFAEASVMPGDVTVRLFYTE